MRTTKKPTADLQPGDKVVWGTNGNPQSIDVVLRIEKQGDTTFKVHVQRNGEATFFYAGHLSEQRVAIGG